MGMDRERSAKDRVETRLAHLHRLENPDYGLTAAQANEAFRTVYEAGSKPASILVRRAFLARRRLLAVFRGLEAKLTVAGGPNTILVSDYSVEHVFPQDSSRWVADYAAWGLDAQAIKNLHDRLHFLGNLTPVTKPHNSALRNKPFADKREGIKNEAAGLKVHGSITRSRSWTATHIDKRGKVLAEAFVKRWPRP